MAKQQFLAQQELTSAQMNALQANDYNWTVSNKTASYVLVAGDKGTRIVMSNAGATTITVNASLFDAGDTLFIQNIGAGTCTITAGTATVTTASSLALAQWGGGTLYFTSASAAIFFSGGGASYGEATGTPTVSATYSDGGFSWKRIDFTSSNNLVVSKAGLFDVLLMGGGGGGGGSTGGGEGGGGGGAGLLQVSTIFIPAGTYAVTVGAGGATGEPAAFGGWSGISVIKSQYAGGAGGGQRWGGAVAGPNSGGASYRSGYGGSAGVASQQLYGFSSGSSDGTGNNGGGAGMGGAGATRAAGAGTASTFTGTSVTYASGGLGGGSSGTFGGSGAANTGIGGGGAIGVSTGGNGGSGFVSVRWKV